MKNFYEIIAVALGSASVAKAAVEADRVTGLPGYPDVLPSTHYSGYLPVGSISG